ncbi:hypothetical protein GH714_033758 [Hevea brasiliensis]|uniref:Uncharacterized protein n=1 Tax=Hevea brasiliensis TaxID=3981 RepID=A0A6A6LP41_HEVBR|nr:hypothetical protein GH714_033758 [Hevea brasiliensis]
MNHHLRMNHQLRKNKIKFYYVTQGGEVFNEELEIIDNRGSKTKKRGPTRAKDIWSLPDGHKIVILFNKLGQPIKKGEGILGERSSVSENLDNATIENGVYDELMGIDKYGHVKGYGLGVKAKEVSVTQSQNIRTTNVEELKMFYEAKLENIKQSYKTKLDGMQQNIVDLQDKLGNVTSLLEKLVASHTIGNSGTSSNSAIECNQQVPHSSSSQISNMHGRSSNANSY